MKPTYEELEERIKSLEDSFQNISSLKKDNEINNSFLEMLFDTIPNPMFYKDINGIYQNCNNAFSKTILGLDKEKIIGKSLYDLEEYIPRKLADIYYEKDKELFIKAGVQTYESKVKCSDNITRHYRFYKSTFVVDKEVLGLVGIMLDITDSKSTHDELDKRNKELNDLSITDWLTSLNNRRYFENIFEKKISLLNRNKSEFFFALIDIDYFKNYNDTLGHHEGDLALKEVSTVLVNNFNRPNDYVFRTGGEEFAILFETTSNEASFNLLDKVRLSVENLHLPACNSKASKYLTVSIGLGNIKYFDKISNSISIYRCVDNLMYEAKKAGRNKLIQRDVRV